MVKYKISGGGRLELSGSIIRGIHMRNKKHEGSHR